MNAPDKELLLAEVLERLRVVEAQLTELNAGQGAAQNKHAASDDLYREELKRYSAESKVERVVQTICRVASICLLLCVAFQVSR